MNRHMSIVTPEELFRQITIIQFLNGLKDRELNFILKKF